MIKTPRSTSQSFKFAQQVMTRFVAATLDFDTWSFYFDRAESYYHRGWKLQEVIESFSWIEDFNPTADEDTACDELMRIDANVFNRLNEEMNSSGTVQLHPVE